MCHVNSNIWGKLIWLYSEGWNKDGKNDSQKDLLESEFYEDLD